MAYFARYMLDEHGNMRKVVINAGVGFVLPYYGETAPPGTLACDGSEISRTVYDELFQVLGTKAGAGDGVSTLNLPDFRGDFIRGLGGEASGLLGQEQAATGIYTYCMGTESSSVGLPVIDTDKLETLPSRSTYNYLPASYQRSTVFTGSRVRPVNVALLWCIIYE